jgi:hypothetical protein
MQPFSHERPSLHPKMTCQIHVNVYISAWIFDGKDSKTHYIAIEGPGLLTKDNSYYEIVNSFRLDK